MIAKIDTKETLWDAKKALADAQEPFLNREKILIAGTNAFQDAEKELLNAKKALADAERATISQRKEVLAAYANWMIADFDESRTWNIVIPFQDYRMFYTDDGIYNGVSE